MNEGKTPQLIAVMGPTASGKTELAEMLADRLEAQLINADAFQVFRGMDIGTSKPADKERYLLLDIKDPSEGFGVGEYVSLAQTALARCWEIQQNVVVVGGSGLYIRALFEEYTDMGHAPDPELRAQLNTLTLDELVAELRILRPEGIEKLDLHNRLRVQRQIERIKSASPSTPVRLPPYKKLKLALIREISDLTERITRRVDAMIRMGWPEEVRELARSGVSPNDPGMRAIGYSAMWQYISGEIELSDATATTIVETRQYAKRQRTWLRSEPGLVVLNGDGASDDALRLVL